MSIEQFISEMPKAELHVHLEGTVEPAMLLELAEKNSVDLGFATEDDVWAAQDYPDPALPHFLDYHYKCVNVLQHPEDFAQVTTAYIETCAINNVRHVEIMFGPMAHTARGVAFEPMFEAMERARSEACERTGVSALWIICIDREHSQDAALEMLETARPYRHQMAGLGLASYEEGNPPSKFTHAYAVAASEGYRLTAHCDCDQRDSVEHIRQCLDVLGVERIDHGLHVLDDDELRARVVADRIALTMCPTWRPRDPLPRRLVPVKTMLDMDMLVSLNTDDPSEFASRHMSHMLATVQREGDFSDSDMVAFMRNAFVSSWASDDQISGWLAELDSYAERASSSQA